MKKQWEIRYTISKKVVDYVSSYVSWRTRRWFPDYPGGDATNLSFGDDFWNDPFPENLLIIREVESLHERVRVVSRLASLIREDLKGQLTNDNRD